MTNWLKELCGDWLLPSVLSVIAGAVDAIGFLALGGLFTAHITGNIVVLAAHYVTGRFSELGPLLAVPVFILVLEIVTLAAKAIDRAGCGSRRVLLVMQTVLLAGCFGLGVWSGPPKPDSPMAILIGMLAVAAMATQNAMVRLDFPGTPSTAVMTTNATQLTIDLATLVGHRADSQTLNQARRRAGVTLACVVGFVAGCAAGAALEIRCGLRASALPLVLSALAVALGELGAIGRAMHRSGKPRTVSSLPLANGSDEG